MAGLQDIWAMVSRWMVTKQVRRPMALAAAAASQPACPAPTTMTSNPSSAFIRSPYFPTQNRPNMSSMTSSMRTSPVSSPTRGRQLRISSA